MTKERVKDKRLRARVSFLEPVQATAISNTNHHWYLLAEDLSEGGLLLFSPERFAVDARLLLGIEADAVSEPIRAIGRVVWVAQADYQDHYGVGIEFVEVNKAARERLRELVADRAKADEDHL